MRYGVWHACVRMHGIDAQGPVWQYAHSILHVNPLSSKLLSFVLKFGPFSCMQKFDLKMPLDEGIQQLQANEPRRRALDDPKETLTFEEFSKLFQ